MNNPDTGFPSGYAPLFRSLAAQYEGLARYDLLRRRDGHTEAEAKFRLDTLDTNDSRTINLEGELNGVDFVFTFDTGAGVNLVSPRTAELCGMEFIDAEVAASGIGEGKGRLAVARRMQLGDIIVENVPFYVLDFTTGNEKADEYLGRLQVIVGIPLIKLFGNIHLDFVRNTMTVRDQPFDDEAINWAQTCCANGNFRIAGKRNREYLTFAVDTGSQATCFNPQFYLRFRDYIDLVGIRDSVGLAGIGGAVRTEVLNLPTICLEIGDGICCFDRTIVHLPDNVAGSIFNRMDGVLGLDFFLKYDHIYIDMKNMRLGMRH